MTKRTGSQKPEERRRRRQNDTVADWGGIDADLLRKLIEAITKSGGAIRFGYTRDGGAFSLGIYGDGKPFTEFHPGNDDAPNWLEGIFLDYE